MQTAATSKHDLVIVLDRIRSAYNVGSVLRTAECAGATEVVTVGYTPKADHPKVKKTSLGAEDRVSTSHFASLAEALMNLRARGYSIYAAESGLGAQSLWEVTLPTEKVAVVFGNEVTGLDPQDIKELGVTALELPMFGVKESLNVANASAIFIYDIIKRWAGSSIKAAIPAMVTLAASLTTLLVALPVSSIQAQASNNTSPPQNLISFEAAIKNSSDISAADFSPRHGSLKSGQLQVFKYVASYDHPEIEDLSIRLILPATNAGQVSIGLIEPVAGPSFTPGSGDKPLNLNEFLFENVIIPKSYNRYFASSESFTEDISLWGDKYIRTPELNIDLRPGGEYYILIYAKQNTPQYSLIINNNYNIDPISMWNIKSGLAFGRQIDLFSLVNTLTIALGIILNRRLVHKVAKSKDQEPNDQPTANPSSNAADQLLYAGVIMLNLAVIAASSVTSGLNPLLLAGLIGNAIALALSISAKTNPRKKLLLNISLIFWLINIVLVSL